MGIIEQELKQTVESGHLFLFFNRRRNCVKVLYFVGDGLAIFYRRLELGTFEMPQALHAADGVAGIEMRLSELTLILEGIELSSVRRRKRWRREVQLGLKIIASIFVAVKLVWPAGVLLGMEHGRSAADFDDLSRQVRQLTALVAEQQATIAQQQATIAAQHEALARASEQLTLLKKALFSPRRERYVPSPDQKLLFVAEMLDAPPAEISPASSAARPTSKPKHRRQFVIPEFLPEQRIEHALPQSRNVPAAAVGKNASSSASMSPARSS